MTRLLDRRSIVAIDPNSRGVAFAFFEDGALLDWGTRRDDDDPMGVIDRLVSRYQADVVVIEEASALRCERRSRIRLLLRRIAKRMLDRRIAVICVGRYDVRRAWAERGATTKHAVAGEIARMFPEIDHLVPRLRKPYESQEVRADIFDAISLVLHTFPIVRDGLESAA
jgi:hypothetical protein